MPKEIKIAILIGFIIFLIFLFLFLYGTLIIGSEFSKKEENKIEEDIINERQNN